MATPSGKCPQIEEALDDLTSSVFGRPRTKSIEQNICVICGNFGKFRDELSKKEFTISGMCQKCQDKVFGRK